VVSATTLLAVVAVIEGGFRMGRAAHSKSEDVKDSPVSAIAAIVLALLTGPRGSGGEQTMNRPTAISRRLSSE
jgi:hypothetical protein